MKPASGLLKLLKSKLVFIGIILLLFIATYSTYLKFYKQKSFINNSSSQLEDESVFINLSQDKYNFVLNEFYSITANDDYWQNWDISKNMIAGDIIKIFPATNELSMNIYSPSDREFTGTNRVGLQCVPSSNVLMRSKNLEFVEGGVTILDKAKVGDIVYAYCMDDNCNSIGKGCVLVSRGTN